jgi:hypothetical protein
MRLARMEGVLVQHFMEDESGDEGYPVAWMGGFQSARHDPRVQRTVARSSEAPDRGVLAGGVPFPHVSPR